MTMTAPTHQRSPARPPHTVIAWPTLIAACAARYRGNYTALARVLSVATGRTIYSSTISSWAAERIYRPHQRTRDRVRPALLAIYHADRLPPDPGPPCCPLRAALRGLLDADAAYYPVNRLRWRLLRGGKPPTADRHWERTLDRLRAADVPRREERGPRGEVALSLPWLTSEAAIEQWMSGEGVL